MRHVCMYVARKIVNGRWILRYQHQRQLKTTFSDEIETLIYWYGKASALSTIFFPLVYEHNTISSKV